MVELFANSGDLDQTPHAAASDLGLHCLPATLLGVSRLQLVKKNANWICLRAALTAITPAHGWFALPICRLRLSDYGYFLDVCYTNFTKSVKRSYDVRIFMVKRFSY